jgi:hypothetical protein
MAPNHQHHHSQGLPHCTCAGGAQTLDLERVTVAKLARIRLQEQREAGKANKDACRTELLATAGVLVGEPVLARKVVRYKVRSSPAVLQLASWQTS